MAIPKSTGKWTIHRIVFINYQNKVVNVFTASEMQRISDLANAQTMVHPMPAEQVGLDNMMKYYQTKKHHQLCRLACGFLGLERIHAIQIRYCVVRWFSPCISKATL